MKNILVIKIVLLMLCSLFFSAFQVQAQNTSCGDGDDYEQIGGDCWHRELGGGWALISSSGGGSDPSGGGSSTGGSSGLGGTGGGDSGDDDAGYGWDDDFGQECWYCDDWGFDYNTNDPNPIQIQDCPFIETRTEATTPANRQRKKIGVGEEVAIKIVFGICKVDEIRWEIINSGTDATIVQSNNMKVKTIKAGALSGKFIVRISYNFKPGSPNLCSACSTSEEVEFEVVAPEGIFYEFIPNPANFGGCIGIGHTKNKVSIWYKALVHLLPDDVSFYNTSTREEAGQLGLGGDYFNQNWPPDKELPTHPQGSWLETFEDVIPGKGTFAGEDLIAFVFLCHSEKNSEDWGEFTYLIPNSYKLTNELSVEPIFCTTRQYATNLGGVNSQLIGEKKNLSVMGFPINFGQVSKNIRLLDNSNCSPVICP